MSAQPAYYSYPNRTPERTSRERIRVVPGRRPAKSTSDEITPTLVMGVALAVFALFAILAFACLGLHAATVSTSIQSQELSNQIDDARTEGTSLEVTQSLLSNPTRVRQQAEKLGMSAPESVGSITLSADVVCTDSDGALSLSDSVKTAATVAGE